MRPNSPQRRPLASRARVNSFAIQLALAALLAGVVILGALMLYMHERQEEKLFRSNGVKHDMALDSIHHISEQQAALVNSIADLHAYMKNDVEHAKVASMVPNHQSENSAAVVTPRPAAITGPPGTLPHRKLFIIVNSYIGAERRRNASRGTWMKDLAAKYGKASGGRYMEVEARYFVGRVEDPRKMAATEAEIKAYGDLTILDFADGYASLGSKVPKIYEHVVANYNATFIAKVDDDTWVNIDVFPRFIETMKPERSYLGLMMEGMEILKGRHKNAENKLPASMKTFPPYASGCATIVTHDLAMLLGRPPIEPIKMVNDDAFLGILFFPFNIEFKSERRIHPWGIKQCLAPDRVGAIHYVPPGCFEKMSANISQGKPICNSHTGCI